MISLTTTQPKCQHAAVVFYIKMYTHCFITVE